MTNPTPEGWYPDPDRPGSTRWWDGAAWGPTPPPAPTTDQSTVARSLGAGSLTIGVVAVFAAVVLDWTVPLILAIVGFALGVFGAVVAKRTGDLGSGVWVAGVVLNGVALLWILIRFAA